ncbi:MAG: aminodeoxychorismate lyase, protein [Candidatus Taylorbacteria bacterium]|nr:aminodeoxychorismate lyase, protein [Candidatus Taylorbacteria bacterium]
MDPVISPTIQLRKPIHPFAIILIIMAIVFCYVLCLFLLPPFGFAKSNPNGVYIDIKNGMSVRQVGQVLVNNKVISSPDAFVLLTSLLRNGNNISTGIYLFKSSVSIFEAEKRIINADYGIEAKKITFPEGFTNKQVAERLEANLPLFDKNVFLSLASTTEGYLYPETYFFSPNDTETVIYKKMIDTFKSETKDLASDFAQSKNTQNDIVIMASILEREVKSKEDKQIVSGILWNRIKNKMALQVDATLAYERDKDSYTLTSADLKDDSPYNTYTRRGLPPTAISNPGYDSIYAALNPTQNNYVYFLTDREGKVYYAKTYEEHLKNKAKYL